MSDTPPRPTLLAAAPVWVGLPPEPPTALAALPCLLPTYPVRRWVYGSE